MTAFFGFIPELFEFVELMVLLPILGFVEVFIEFLDHRILGLHQFGIISPALFWVVDFGALAVGIVGFWGVLFCNR